MTNTTLYYRQGSSDKIYQVEIKPTEGGYRVDFAYGRRGSTLNTGTKTAAPVSLEEATRIHDKLVTEKKAKGYTPGANGTPYTRTEDEGKISGVQCQLLNPIEHTDLPQYIGDPEFWMQEKIDGKRLLIRKAGAVLHGINRRGLLVGLPEPLFQHCLTIPGDFILDGEIVGNVYHPFDLLELDQTDLRPVSYMERYLMLIRFFDWNNPVMKKPVTACVTEEKKQMYDRLKAQQTEGVVFKHIAAPYVPGRPASGGSQLKLKFYATASFIVGAQNEQRSVVLLLTKGKGMVPAGNVTIPPNQPVPASGSVIEVRYLYAFRESGAVYQPTFLMVRDDIRPCDCTPDQLKYKAKEEAAA